MGAIVERLGHPEDAFQSIHVAGTNGKGSVTAMVDAGLRAAGHRSARYTSPHLIDLAERFTIDGHPVTADRMIATGPGRRSAPAVAWRHCSTCLSPTPPNTLCRWR